MLAELPAFVDYEVYMFIKNSHERLLV